VWQVNFKLFIYYCSVLGGWAALMAWGGAYLLGAGRPDSEMAGMAKATLIAACLGALVAFAVGLVDAFLNATGAQRGLRALVCAGVGLVGGVIGGLLGEGLHSAGLPRVIGWMIVGIFIGASIGVFDIVAASMSKGDMRVPIKRTLNGIYGGLLGGLLGGLPFGLLMSLGDPNADPWAQPLPVSRLAIGLVILGLLIGALIALAQVFLKEAWLQIDSGRRAGKQVMVNKDEIVIGRAEGVDLGLYGEQGIEKQHARIILKNSQYFLEDNGTPGGTFVNDERIQQRVLLHNGDKIQVGTAVLRFGERAKK
jgi:hypothetical protein